MTVRILDDAEKTAVVTLYKDNSIKELTKIFKVSAKTITRVLEEKGALASPAARSADANKVMQLLYERKISPDVLEAILDTPALIPSNVALFLKDCTKEQLYVIFQQAGLIENAEEAIRKLSGLAVLGAPEGKPIPKSAQMSLELPLTRCAAARDGECSHKQCPQLRDNEPQKSGRHCPLDKQAEEEQQ